MDALEFRRRRRTAEVSQDQAAKVLGLHRTMIGQFELRRCLLRPDQLWRLKEWLELEEIKRGIRPPRAEVTNGQG